VGSEREAEIVADFFLRGGSACVIILSQHIFNGVEGMHDVRFVISLIWRFLFQ
jgi:hypothetical protein